MRVAREAPDGSLRNAGLALLSRLAARRPRAVLDHVLQVCMGEKLCGGPASDFRMPQ